MTAEFRPSTRTLLRIMGWEGRHPYSEPHDEPYRIHEIVIEIGNRVYRACGEAAYRDGRWEVDADLLVAARDALLDNAGTYAGHGLAYLLVRAGATDDEALAQLHPWDALAFRWQAAGLTAADVAATLDVTDAVDRAQLEMIDRWIAEPITALGDWFQILTALFDPEQRLVVARLRDMSDDVRHHELLETLLARAEPPVEIRGARQDWHANLVEVNQPLTISVNRGDGKPATLEAVLVNEDRGFGLVRFAHAGVEHMFRYQQEGSWMDTDAVVRAANGFLRQIHHPGHVFRFETARGESAEYGAFLTAHATRFAEAATRLSLPLVER
jgi:hypothetical protein